MRRKPPIVIAQDVKASGALEYGIQLAEGMAAAHVPRLAGQSADYLQKQLNDYATGARATGPNGIMPTIAKRLSPDDMRNSA